MVLCSDSGEIVRTDTASVIDNLKPRFTIVFNLDFDEFSSGIDWVLNKLFHRYRQIEYNLRRANFVD